MSSIQGEDLLCEVFLKASGGCSEVVLCFWGRISQGREALAPMCIHKESRSIVTNLRAGKAALPSLSAEGLGQVPVSCS